MPPGGHTRPAENIFTACSSRAAYASPMSMFLFLMSGILTSVPVPPAMLQQRGDQQRVWEAMRAGRMLPLREIERRVVPQVKGEYLGPEIDPETGIYTLKFLSDGRVIWVRVDGRTGQIIGRTG